MPDSQELVANELFGVKGDLRIRCRSLRSLSLANSKNLFEIDLVETPELRELSVATCKQLRAINAEGAPALSVLSAPHCFNLAALYVQGCSALREVSLFMARTLGDEALASLLAAAAPSLRKLNAGGLREITALRVCPDPAVPGSLAALEGPSQALSPTRCHTYPKLDVTGCARLVRLEVSAPALVALHTAGCTSLSTVDLDLPGYTAPLSLDKLPALASLLLSAPRIPKLVLDDCASLTRLRLSCGALRTLDVRGTARLPPSALAAGRRGIPASASVLSAGSATSLDPL
eukprot:tig00000042_g15399.t1